MEGGDRLLKDLLHKFIYALFSGFTEFLGVSAPPHQLVYASVTGFIQSDALLSLMIRLGVLMAAIVCCRGRIRRLMRERRLSGMGRRRRNRQPDVIALLDLRLLKTAIVPLLISVLFYRRAGQWIDHISLMIITLLLNGVFLFIPRLLSQGNKDGRSVSRLDGVLIGIGGALAAIPGFSRVGGMISAGTARGVDRGYALETALLLSIPVLLGLLIFDVYAVIAAKLAIGLATLVVYILLGAVSFGGAWVGITFMRYLSIKAGFTGFSYYSWGLALFSFILYLMV
jgi:undecaprenyl-diphosphatase